MYLPLQIIGSILLFEQLIACENKKVLLVELESSVGIAPQISFYP